MESEVEKMVKVQTESKPNELVIRISGPISEKMLNLINSALELVKESAREPLPSSQNASDIFVPLKEGAVNLLDEEEDPVVKQLSREVKAGMWNKLKHRYLPDEPADS